MILIFQFKRRHLSDHSRFKSIVFANFYRVFKTYVVSNDFDVKIHSLIHEQFVFSKDVDFDDDES